MGAVTFENFGSKEDYDTPKSAFNAIKDHELWYNGHGGYTGTIAEKPGFIMRNNGDPVAEDEIQDFIYDDGENNEKWGPAYCVPICKSNEDTEIIGWMFYGWASS